MQCSTPDLCAKYATTCEVCYGVTANAKPWTVTQALPPAPESAPKKQPKPNRHERRERKRAAVK